MSYRRILLFRWSRRDVLAVVALAAIVAFLTGSALFFSAAEDRPTDLANDYGSIAEVTDYRTVDAARTAAQPDDVVLAYTALEGNDTLVVGLSGADTDRLRRADIQPPDVPSTGVGRVGSTVGNRTVETAAAGETTLHVTGSVDNGMLPERWYIGRPAVVERLGPSGAILVRPVVNGTGTPSPATGKPADSVVRGTLIFFERGTAQVLRGFALVVVAAIVLGGVTVTSVVRMTVSDRDRTIQVIRASGGAPSSVLGLFAVRGLLLTVAAVALGYAVGVVASSVVVSVAVFAGLPTSLSPRVSADAIRLLTIIYVPVLAIGCLSGVIGALPAVRRPPVPSSGRVQSSGSGRLLARFRSISHLDSVASRLAPSVLDWRAVVPTTATMTVFTALVLLVLAGGTVATPLTTSSATVLQPDAKHPFSSSVPESYASAFESQGVSASPEILVFGVVDDEPALVRGARYDAFASVSNASLVAGSKPNGTAEAVVGQDFADTHDVAVGETLALGGGVVATVERVRIVGTYRAPGVFDDQVLVSLETARHLSLKRGSTVNFIRLSRPIEETSLSDVQVTGVTVAGPATTERVDVRVTLRNLGTTAGSRELVVSFGGERKGRNVTLSPGNQTVETFTFTPAQPGSYTLTIGERSRTVRVVDADALVLRGLPGTVPVDSFPEVTVRTAAGRPVANATVTVANRTVRTAGDGSARLPIGGSGPATVRITAGERQLNRTVTVSANATRRLGVSVRVVPDEVAAFTRPTARVRFSNPWNTSISRSFELRTARTMYRRQVTVGGGGAVTRSIQLSRLPSGEYRTEVTVADDERAVTSYQVVGEDRLSTVVARNTDTEAGASLGVAVATVFGNLQVIVGGLLSLAAVMVGGTLVASFSRSIHARRHTLGVYRVTGATPRQVWALLLRDGLVIGVVSVVAGLLCGAGLLWLLDVRDVLVFYGISVTPRYSLPVLVFVAGAALALVLVGASVSTAAVLRSPPTSLFETDARPPEEESE